MELFPLGEDQKYPRLFLFFLSILSVCWFHWKPCVLSLFLRLENTHGEETSKFTNVWLSDLDVFNKLFRLERQDGTKLKGRSSQLYLIDEDTSQKQQRWSKVGSPCLMAWSICVGRFVDSAVTFDLETHSSQFFTFNLATSTRSFDWTRSVSEQNTHWWRRMDSHYSPQICEIIGVISVDILNIR